MPQQEYLLKLQVLEQQANQFGEQLSLIEQQINELNKLKENISKFEESKQKEIFAEFGRGIYIKADIADKSFLIDVGAGVMVPKSVKEVEEIIELQIKKFEEIKPEIAKRVDMVNKELDRLISESQKEKNNAEKPAKKDKKAK